MKNSILNQWFSEEEIKQHERLAEKERKKHPYKSRFSSIGICNAFGSIPDQRPGEVYRLLMDYDAMYAVSNIGHVASFTSGRLLRFGQNEHDYAHVGLMLDGKETTIKVHRLVAENFCDNRMHKTDLHHLDRKRSNNCADNLLWVTSEEHEELHALLREADKTGDYSVYCQRVEEIRKDNSRACLKNVASLYHFNKMAMAPM